MEQSRTPADRKMRRERLLILARGKKRKVEVPWDDRVFREKFRVNIQKYGNAIEYGTSIFAG